MGKIKIATVVAMDLDRVIGVNNTIPWRYPQDMRHFANLTIGHSVLMGRNTYASLPAKFRPLPKRLNIVAGRTCQVQDYPSEVRLCKDVIDFLERVKAGQLELAGDYLWIMGGAQIYKMTVPYWEEVFLTLVPEHHNGDAFFPEFEDNFTLESETLDSDGLAFRKYVRK